MENIAITAPELCGCCFKSVGFDDAFCDSCGYPLKGTEAEQKDFTAIRNGKEIDLDAAREKINKAGSVLYWISGATLIVGFLLFMIAYVKDGDNSEAVATLVVNIILGGIYLALASWSKTKPFAAIVSGLSLYVLVIIISAIVSPVSLASGFIVKIIFIIYFVKGIKSALEAETLKKELNLE